MLEAWDLDDHEGASRQTTRWGPVRPPDHVQEAAVRREALLGLAPGPGRTLDLAQGIFYIGYWHNKK